MYVFYTAQSTRLPTRACVNYGPFECDYNPFAGERRITEECLDQSASSSDGSMYPIAVNEKGIILVGRSTAEFPM